LATKSRLRDVAMVQLGVSGLATLGLDLTDIRFLDSSGISVLVELRSQARERGIDLEILAVSRRAARVLTIVGLADSFGIPHLTPCRRQPILTPIGARPIGSSSS